MRDLRTTALAVGALGVVYGDIGTNPLFALRDAFEGPHHVGISEANVLGLLSLVFWSLIVVITIKYLTFVTRADNDGEGGILALSALAIGKDPVVRGRRWLLLLIGLFGAALLYGDGMITPAISVLAAVEGTSVAAPSLHRFVVPAAVLVLIGLFSVQSSRHRAHRTGLRSGHDRVVHHDRRPRRRADRPATDGAARRLPRLRDLVLRAQRIHRVPGARGRGTGRRRRRGAVRRPRSLRPQADPRGVVRGGPAEPAARVLRPGGTAAPRTHGRRQPVLPAGPRVGARSAGDPRHERDGDRVAGA